MTEREYWEAILDSFPVDGPDDTEAHTLDPDVTDGELHAYALSVVSRVETAEVAA